MAGEFDVDSTQAMHDFLFGAEQNTKNYNDGNIVIDKAETNLKGQDRAALAREAARRVGSNRNAYDDHAAAATREAQALARDQNRDRIRELQEKANQGNGYAANVLLRLEALGVSTKKIR